MDNLAVFDLVFKDVYLPKVKDVQKRETIFYDKIRRTNKSLEGKTFRFSLQDQMNEGMHAVAESAAHPTPGASAFKQAYTSLKYTAGKMKVSIVAENLIKKPAALVSAITTGMRGTAMSYKMDLNRQFLGDGTGEIGTISDVTGLVITIANAKHVRVGMVLDFFAATGSPPANRSSADGTVTAVNKATGEVTVTDVTGVVATDKVYRKGAVAAVGSSLVSYEVPGVGAMISNTGTYQGINRGTYDWYQSVVNTAGSDRALDLLLLTKFLQDIENQSGETPDEILCSQGVYRGFLKMLASQTVNTPMVMSKIGFKKGIGFVHNGKVIPIWSAYYMYDNSLVALNYEGIVIGHGWHLKWETSGGILKLDPNTLDHFALFTEGLTIYSTMPWAHGAMDSLLEPTSMA